MFVVDLYQTTWFSQNMKASAVQSACCLHSLPSSVKKKKKSINRARLGYEFIPHQKGCFSFLQPVSKWFVNSGWRCRGKNCGGVY